MALTNVEKQQRFRERQRAKRKSIMAGGTPPEEKEHYSLPFCDWVSQDGNWPDFEYMLDLIGFEPPDFSDDRGARSFSGEPELVAENFPVSPYANAQNSLGRAEMMTGVLIDAATALAEIIRRYKQSELTAKIRDLENKEPSDASERKAILMDLIKLNDQMKSLSGSIRRTFPSWRADL